MSRLLPDSIAGRTLLVLLTGIVLSLFVATAMYFSEAREALSFLDNRRVAERIAAITRLVEKTRPAERDLALARFMDDAVGKYCNIRSMFDARPRRPAGQRRVPRWRWTSAASAVTIHRLPI